jgi:hypothetical protein
VVKGAVGSQGLQILAQGRELLVQSRYMGQVLSNERMKERILG